MPSAKAASSPCLLPPTLEFGPTAEPIGQPPPLLVPNLGWDLPSRSPTGLQDLSNTQCTATTHQALHSPFI